MSSFRRCSITPVHSQWKCCLLLSSPNICTIAPHQDLTNIDYRWAYHNYGCVWCFFRSKVWSWNWLDIWLAPTTSVSEPAIHGLALEKGENRTTLKWRERAIIALIRDELKRSSTSFSSITTCESTAQWVAVMSTPSFSVSTLQCYEQPTDTVNVEPPLFSTKWMSTANQVPERQLWRWKPGPFSCPTSCRWPNTYTDFVLSISTYPLPFSKRSEIPLDQVKDVRIWDHFQLPQFTAFHRLVLQRSVYWPLWNA